MKNSIYKISLSILLITLIFAAKGQIKVIPYQQLQSTTGMYFGASMSTSTITVTFSGPSNRWIALGLGSSMTGCDILIYSNGQNTAPHALGWNDYYSGNTSASNLTNDATQNWTITSNNVASGQRTVVASRVLNTGDSNDAVINYTATALNIVWARSASADYTVAYHGGSNRGFGISLQWLSQPVASFSAISTTVCTGAPVTFSNTSTGGQNSYFWNLPGTNLSVSSATNPVVTYTSPGTYSVVLTASNAVGTDTFTQVNYITVTPTVVPTVAILQTGGGNPICSGAAATFSANYSNGGPSPVFQWKVNGANSGGNSAVFTSTALPNPCTVSLVMTANSVCAVPNTATSSALTLTVNSSAPAGINIGLSGGSNPLCNGSTVTFTANPVNGGASPTYQWKINNVAVGNSTSSFSTNTLANGNVVTCEIVSSSTCAVTTTAVSSGITLTVSSVLVPSVNINLSAGTNPLCAGTVLSFSATAGNGGTNPSYQWKVNGANAGTNSAVFSPTALVNGAIVNCVMTSNSSCSSPNTATSSAITLTVNPIPPSPTITPTGNLNLCSGNSLTLSSSASTGNNWSNGANTQSIVITNSGTFSVNQTLNGCSSAPSSVVSISVIPSPTVTLLSVNPLCKDDAPVVLQGSPSGGTFSGTGLSGNTFNPLASGTGTFSVNYQYTAPNLCTDSANVSILVSECTGANEIFENQQYVMIYPNPANSQVFISTAGNKIDKVEMTDFSGKLILTKIADNSDSLILNLKGNSAGTYFLSVYLNNTVARKKLILIE